MTLSLRGKLLAASLGVVLLMAALLGIVAFHTLKSRTLDAIQSEAVNYGHAHSVAIGQSKPRYRLVTRHKCYVFLSVQPQQHQYPF